MKQAHLTAVAASATLAAVAMSVPPARAVIEQSMAWHMAFQMPLLVLAGALLWALYLAVAPTRRAGWLATLRAVNMYGLTGFMAAQGIIAYWMLPTAIDRAVVNPAFDVLKLLCLLVCGALLCDAFKRAPVVLQLFFMGYWVPMMCWLGIYSATTDLRLCNAYAQSSQVAAGWAMLLLGLLSGLAWFGWTWFNAMRHKGAQTQAAQQRATPCQS